VDPPDSPSARPCRGSLRRGSPCHRPACRRERRRRKVHSRRLPPARPGLRRGRNGRGGKNDLPRIDRPGDGGGEIHPCRFPPPATGFGDLLPRWFGCWGRFRRLYTRKNGLPNDTGNRLARLYAGDAASVLDGRGDVIFQPAPLHTPRNPLPDIRIGFTEGILGASFQAPLGSPPDPKDLEVRSGPIDARFHPRRPSGLGVPFPCGKNRRAAKENRENRGSQGEGWNFRFSHCGYFLVTHRFPSVNDDPPRIGNGRWGRHPLLAKVAPSDSPDYTGKNRSVSLLRKPSIRGPEGAAHSVLGPLVRGRVAGGRGRATSHPVADVCRRAAPGPPRRRRRRDPPWGAPRDPVRCRGI